MKYKEFLGVYKCKENIEYKIYFDTNKKTYLVNEQEFNTRKEAVKHLISKIK